MPKARPLRQARHLPLLILACCLRLGRALGNRFPDVAGTSNGEPLLMIWMLLALFHAGSRFDPTTMARCAPDVFSGGGGHAATRSQAQRLIRPGWNGADALSAWNKVEERR